MSSETRTRRAKSKGETLSPLTGHPPKVMRGGLLPGFKDEPRPLLGFILRVLDGEHRRMIRQHLKYFLHLDFQACTPEMETFLGQLQDDPALLLYAIDGMIETMREMADMWIESGRDRTNPDFDAPANRNVEDVLPGRAYSLALKIDRSFLMSYPRYTEMRRDGSLQIVDRFPRFEPEHLKWGVKAALEDHGAKWAAFYFSRLLNSPDSRRIARCDHCKAYFAYQRARLSTVKIGVSCPACKGKASMKRTKTSRAKRLDTAAKAWLEWNPRKAIEQRQWVADRVSDTHATTLGRRWVSQNLKGILERVEALQNAKRQS